MIRTSANPRIVDVPNRYRIVAVMRLDTFESRIEFQARLKPASGGRRDARPELFLHPFEDQDVGVLTMPIESTKPAMPASVSVTG